MTDLTLDELTEITNECDVPFLRADISLKGDVYPCSPYLVLNPIGNILTQPLDEIWGNAAAQSYRASMTDQSFRFCMAPRCIKAQNVTEYEGLPRGVAAVNKEEDKQIPPLTLLVLSYDPSCTLACRICRSSVFVAEEPELRNILDNITDRVIAYLASDNQVRTIRIAEEGEPFASPSYLRILQYLAGQSAALYDIELLTNGLFLTEPVWQILAGLERHRVSIQVSVNGVWPQTHANPTPGENRPAILENLVFIAGLKATGRIKKFSLKMVVTQDNYLQIPILIVLAKAVGCDLLELAHPVHLASHLDGVFDDINVVHHDHREHPALREILKSPLLGDPMCKLSDKLHSSRIRALLSDSVSSPLTKNGPRPEQDYLALAKIFQQNQKIDVAVALLASASLHFGHSPALWAALGSIMMELGAFARAADMFHQARSLSQDQAYEAELKSALEQSLAAVVS